MASSVARLARRNLMVDDAKIRRLRSVLRASSDSAAVRAVVENALNSTGAIRTLERLRKRKTWGRC